MTLWDRHSPRIAYQVPIGVLDLQPQRLMNVMSMNVSRGGMFVGASELLDVGSEIMCNLPMHRDREAMQLRARVAWQRPGCFSDELHPQGMGIEFLDLSDSECDELIDIVGDLEEESHPVRMSLAGLGPDVPAHAKISGDTAHLRVPLSYLRLGTELTFSFSVDSTDTPCHGVIERVAIHEDPGSPTPRLQLDLKLTALGGGVVDSAPVLKQPVETSVLGQRAAIESGTIEISMTEDDSVPWRGSAVVDELEEAAVVGALASDTERMSVPLNTDRRLWIGGAAVVLAAIAALAFGISSADEPKPFVPSIMPGEGSLLTGDAPAKPSQGAELGEAVVLQSAVASGPTEVAPVPAAKPAPVAPKRVKTSAKPAVAAAKPAKRSRQKLGGVEFSRREAGKLIIRIPIDGSIEQASNYVLASPPAIAVNLPYAKPARGYQQNLYPDDPKLRVVWVRERLGGLHFRVFFDNDVPECQVKIEKSSIELRCKA